MNRELAHLAEPLSELAFSEKSPAKPFIKWAGGKTQLIHELVMRIPDTYGTYFEPFLGGGALFFMLRPKPSVLSDINAELVNCYEVVKNDVVSLITHLERHEHSKEYFLALREMDRREDFGLASSVERASRFLYLNKTCYNGLYRVNSKGQFNVPFGSYVKPKILDAKNLMNCSEVLRDVDLQHDSFGSLEDRAESGDFVYFDPPYVPLSSTAHFTSYSQEGFGVKDHIALAELCKRLDKKGVQFLLSNSYVDLNLSLYKDFRIEKVRASRSINSQGKKRGRIYEILVRNY